MVFRPNAVAQWYGPGVRRYDPGRSLRVFAPGGPTGACVYPPSSPGCPTHSRTCSWCPDLRPCRADPKLAEGDDKTRGEGSVPTSFLRYRLRLGVYPPFFSKVEVGRTKERISSFREYTGQSVPQDTELLCYGKFITFYKGFVYFATGRFLS